MKLLAAAVCVVWLVALAAAHDDDSCPENEEHRGNSKTKCYCVSGSSRIGGVCRFPCPDNMKRNSGHECVCRFNYEMIDGVCVEKCGRNSVRHHTGECRCNEGFEFVGDSLHCKQQKLADFLVDRKCVMKSEQEVPCRCFKAPHGIHIINYCEPWPLCVLEISRLNQIQAK